MQLSELEDARHVVESKSQPGRLDQSIQSNDFQSSRTLTRVGKEWNTTRDVSSD